MAAVVTDPVDLPARGGAEVGAHVHRDRLPVLDAGRGSVAFELATTCRRRDAPAIGTRKAVLRRESIRRAPVKEMDLLGRRPSLATGDQRDGEPGDETSGNGRASATLHVPSLPNPAESWVVDQAGAIGPAWRGSVSYRSPLNLRAPSPRNRRTRLPRCSRASPPRPRPGSSVRSNPGRRPSERRS